jgi:hypothetical protein
MSQMILEYITDLVCNTHFHWFFNPECQHIFGKTDGVYMYVFGLPHLGPKKQ